MDTQALVTQLRYSEWPTKRLLKATASVSQDDLYRDLGNSKFNQKEYAGGVFGALAHVFQADSIWFDRLIGRTTTDLSRYDPSGDLAAKWSAVHREYVSWAEKLAPADWDRVVDYKSLKGEPFQTPIWQIVLHVVNHATYHRGQVTTMLRQLGGTPVTLDLIAYYRETSGQ